MSDCRISGVPVRSTLKEVSKDVQDLHRFLSPLLPYHGLQVRIHVAVGLPSNLPRDKGVPIRDRHVGIAGGPVELRLKDIVAEPGDGLDAQVLQAGGRPKEGEDQWQELPGVVIDVRRDVDAPHEAHGRGAPAEEEGLQCVHLAEAKRLAVHDARRLAADLLAGPEDGEVVGRLLAVRLVGAAAHVPVLAEDDSLAAQSGRPLLPDVHAAAGLAHEVLVDLVAELTGEIPACLDVSK